MSIDSSNLLSIEPAGDMGHVAASDNGPPPLPGNQQVAIPPAPEPPPPPVPPPAKDRLATPPSPVEVEEIDGGLPVDLPSFLASAVVHLTLLVTLALWSSGVKNGGGDLAVGPPLVALVGDEQGIDQSENLTIADELAEPARDDQLEQVLGPVDLNAAVLDSSPAGLPTGTATLPDAGFELKTFGGDLRAHGDLADELAKGANGFGGSFGARASAARRAAMVRSGGGTLQSEQAVNLALAWLAEHQSADGGWSYDHASAPNCQNKCSNPGNMANARIAATGMALLPFLGAGQTHKDGKYKKNIEAGLYFLIRSMKVGGSAGSLMEPGGRMYGHGLASIALCEAYAMTQDSLLRQPAQAALNFIIQAQDPRGGGWRYQPKEPGDTSVVGWQLMALKSGHLARLKVSPTTVHKANYFLDSVQSEYGSRYGYMGPGGGAATTAIGLLCRMYIGWKHDHPGLVRGAEVLSKMGPATDASGPDRGGMYYNYYATQVLHHFGGPQWESWNVVMREYLIRTQSHEGHEQGSWYFPGDDHGANQGGRLYCTAMAAMVLEVYYRHMPLYGDESTTKSFFK